MRRWRLCRSRRKSEPTRAIISDLMIIQGGTTMSAPQYTPVIDEAKLNEFMGKAVGDMGAAMHAVLVLLGDRLGLYKGMADSSPVTPAELAERTGTHERYVREWLDANA